MSAIFNKNIRNFSSEAFFSMVKERSLVVAMWVTGKSYNVGDQVIWGYLKYIASSAGTSGVTPPTHKGGEASDGGVNWIYIQPIRAADSYKGNLFITIGRNYEWGNGGVPDVPEMTDFYDYGVMNDIISLRKVSYAEMRLGIRRNEWTSGTVYDQYDSEKDVLTGYTNPFYVIADGSTIYKCINNNNGAPSTSRPSGSPISNLINTIDGYSWKFMMSIGMYDYTEFLTNSLLPVYYKEYDDGGSQWDVQAAAKVKSISTFRVDNQVGTFTTPEVAVTTTSIGTGATAFATKTIGNNINQILISACGQNYEKDETYAIVKETGATGSGATATATVAGGIITLITVNLPGAGYTGGATVLITGAGTGATATATIAIDDTVQTIAVNLGGTGYVTATTKVHIIPGTSAAVGTPIMAPLKGHGHNVVSELEANAVILSVKLAANTHFLEGVDSDFRQICVLTDPLTISGGDATGSVYIGPAHPEYTNGASILSKIKANSGTPLFVSNIIAATRATNQEERIKIAIEF